MQTTDLKLSLIVLEELFPCEGQDGQNVAPSAAATARAAAELDIPWQEVRWVAPDVFNIRYGSSWVASAFSQDGRRVRFHCAEVGDFRDGDDEGFDE